MANRRMMSKSIVDNDYFLNMPITARLLYYELNWRADDDGFVDKPKSIMKMVGCSEDDYTVLIAKRFIIEFESGVCVIRHWLIHNMIRVDRYHETKYIAEKSLLTQQESEVGRYYEVSNYAEVGMTERQPPGTIPIPLPNTKTNNIYNNSNKEYILECFNKTWIYSMNKKNKEYARNTYIKKMKKCKMHEQVQKKAQYIFREYKKSIQDWQENETDKKYIPMFSTWLNKNIGDDPIYEENI